MDTIKEQLDGGANNANKLLHLFLLMPPLPSLTTQLFFYVTFTCLIAVAHATCSLTKFCLACVMNL